MQALQKRYAEQETKLAALQRASLTSKQAVALAQQRSSEYEKRCKDLESELEASQSRFDRSEESRNQLDAEHSLLKLQLEDQELKASSAKVRDLNKKKLPQLTIQLLFFRIVKRNLRMKHLLSEPNSTRCWQIWKHSRRTQPVKVQLNPDGRLLRVPRMVMTRGLNLASALPHTLVAPPQPRQSASLLTHHLTTNPSQILLYLIRDPNPSPSGPLCTHPATLLPLPPLGRDHAPLISRRSPHPPRAPYRSPPLKMTTAGGNRFDSYRSFTLSFSSDLHYDIFTLTLADPTLSSSSVRLPFICHSAISQ